MPIPFPPLPFSQDALEPAMSAETLEYHHGQHHKTYVETLNALIVGTDYESMPLRQIVEKSGRSRKDAKVFSNAGQAWNHAFFWDSLSPDSGQPGAETAAAITAAFGGHDKFLDTFKEAAMGVVGSGWVWLCRKNGKLAIVSTPNAEPGFLKHGEPVFVADVWEHAYYLDHRNAREAYVETLLGQLVNWAAVEGRLAALKQHDEAKADIRRQAGGKGREPWFIA